MVKLKQEPCKSQGGSRMGGYEINKTPVLNWLFYMQAVANCKQLKMFFLSGIRDKINPISFHDEIFVWKWPHG